MTREWIEKQTKERVFLELLDDEGQKLNGQLAIFDTSKDDICVLLVDVEGRAVMVAVYQRHDPPDTEVDTWCKAILTYNELARKWTEVN